MVIFAALIAHYRLAPAHRICDDVLIGCDICDAFNIVNGFRNAQELEDHTKKVHGEVNDDLKDITNMLFNRCFFSFLSNMN